VVTPEKSTSVVELSSFRKAKGHGNRGKREQCAKRVAMPPRRMPSAGVEPVVSALRGGKQVRESQVSKAISEMNLSCKGDLPLFYQHFLVVAYNTWREVMGTKRKYLRDMCEQAYEMSSRYEIYGLCHANEALILPLKCGPRVWFAPRRQFVTQQMRYLEWKSRRQELDKFDAALKYKINRENAGKWWDEAALEDLTGNPSIGPFSRSWASTLIDKPINRETLPYLRAYRQWFSTQTRWYEPEVCIERKRSRKKVRYQVSKLFDIDVAALPTHRVRLPRVSVASAAFDLTNAREVSRNRRVRPARRETKHALIRGRLENPKYSQIRSSHGEITEGDDMNDPNAEHYRLWMLDDYPEYILPLLEWVPGGPLREELMRLFRDDIDDLHVVGLEAHESDAVFNCLYPVPFTAASLLSQLYDILVDWVGPRMSEIASSHGSITEEDDLDVDGNDSERTEPVGRRRVRGRRHVQPDLIQQALNEARPLVPEPHVPERRLEPIDRLPAHLLTTVWDRGMTRIAVPLRCMEYRYRSLEQLLFTPCAFLPSQVTLDMRMLDLGHDVLEQAAWDQPFTVDNFMSNPRLRINSIPHSRIVAFLIFIAVSLVEHVLLCASLGMAGDPLLWTMSILKPSEIVWLIWPVFWGCAYVCNALLLTCVQAFMKKPFMVLYMDICDGPLGGAAIVPPQVDLRNPIDRVIAVTHQPLYVSAEIHLVYPTGDVRPGHMYCDRLICSAPLDLRSADAAFYYSSRGTVREVVDQCMARYRGMRGVNVPLLSGNRGAEEWWFTLRVAQLRRQSMLVDALFQG